MGGYCFSTGVYLVWVSLFVLTRATDNTPESIVDGNIISGGTSLNAIKSLESIWTLHVVVVHPPNGIPLGNPISRLQELIAAFPSTSRADEVLLSYWQHRLQLIRPTAPPVATFRERRRRGLIDVGGQLLHSIFGLATSNQVDISRQMIKLVRASNQHIIHQTNNMVTVINQTYNEMVLNRQHIQDVERSLSDLYTHVNTWIAVRHVAWGRISASLQIDRCFNLIESAQISWDKRRARFHAQRGALETGRLTEALLPIEELGKILKHSNARGQYTPRCEWFYQFVTVTPIWRTNDDIVYIAHIPLAGHAKFLRYKIETWPFLHVASNVKLQIELPSDVAYDTTEGLMFIPHKCVGNAPQICHTGPIYRKKHFSCIRGVLTNDVSLRNTCKLTIHRDSAIAESILEIRPNTFLIVSGGGEIKVFCKGEQRRTVKLPAGSSKIHVNPNCRLTNDRWMITGIKSFDVNVTLTTPSVPVTAFNWSNLISNTQIHAHLKARKWRAFPSIKHISLAKLQTPLNAIDEEEWSLTSISPSSYWPFLIVGFLLISGLLFIGAYKYNWFGFFRPREHPTDNPSPPQEAIAMPPLSPAGCVSILSTHAEFLDP